MDREAREYNEANETLALCTVSPRNPQHEGVARCGAKIKGERTDQTKVMWGKRTENTLFEVSIIKIEDGL